MLTQTEEPPSRESAETDVTSPLSSLARWVRHTLSGRHENSLKEALEEVLHEHDSEEGQSISGDEISLLRNMIAFGELTVDDVMIPRPDIFAVPDTVGIDDLKHQIAEKRHTRIPVFHGSLDHVTGFLHIKDFMMCLMSGVSFDVETMKREILFVPHSMKIVDLLLKMRVSSSHMAIVVDEYGGTDGLVTMEDLFEEIVGEIHDEHDDLEEQPEISWVSERIMVADARADIDDVAKKLGVELTQAQGNDDFDTLGGLLYAHLGRIPAKGEVIEFGRELKFEIITADPRRIRKVRIVKQA